MFSEHFPAARAENVFPKLDEWKKYIVVASKTKLFFQHPEDILETLLTVLLKTASPQMRINQNSTQD